MGAQLFVKAAQSGRIFFLCTMCGTAWTRPQKPMTLDEINDPKDMAPAGIELPSRSDIERAGMADLIVTEANDWAKCLEDYLKPPRY